MDEQPDILSFEPERPPGARRLGPGRPRTVAVSVLVVLVASLGATAWLAVQTTHQSHTIAQLRTALAKARPSASVPADASGPVPGRSVPIRPVVTGNAIYTLPGAGGGSFTVDATAIRSRQDPTSQTWLFVDGRGARPGGRYGLLEGRCGGQYVTPTDLADGTADESGHLRIAVTSSPINPLDGDIWVMLYQQVDGLPLGGVQGPLASPAGKAFRTAPAC